MRDFSWKYFMMTGDVDAYMLYKEINNGVDRDEWEQDEPLQEETADS